MYAIRSYYVYDIADDRDDQPGAVRLLHRQPDFGPLGAADEADGVTQAGVGHVDRFVAPLGDHQDDVFGVQLPLAGRGAAGDDVV